jgi:hypothetical protein
MAGAMSLKARTPGSDGPEAEQRYCQQQTESRCENGGKRQEQKDDPDEEAQVGHHQQRKQRNRDQDGW